MADLPRSPTGDMDYGAMVQSLQSAQPSSTDPELAGLPPELMRSVNALISQRQGGTRQEGAPFQDATDPLGSAMLALGFIGPRFGGMRGAVRAPVEGAPPPTPKAATAEELKAALGTENFASAHASLESLSAEEAKALAKEFFGYGSYSSKAEALKKIWNRNQALEQVKAKSRFMAGRSAG